MDDVLSLISITTAKDAYGVLQESETSREVFCRVNSVSRSEFYNAGRNGLNPEYEFEVFSGDYDGEKICSYNGYRYSIYRTYHVPGEDYIELYVQRKGGTNG